MNSVHWPGRVARLARRWPVRPLGYISPLVARARCTPVLAPDPDSARPAIPSENEASRTLLGRNFHTTRIGRKTVSNPRQDEDGQEMEVAITARAAHRLQQIIAKDQNPDLMLRVTVESGGCHGFQYLMSLTDSSKVDQAEDTVFQADDEPDARIVMDEPSLNLLKGSKVDYSTELIGSQFKIVDNPLATSSCGCGTSFDIKV